MTPKSYAPIPKVRNGGLAAFLLTLIFYVMDRYGVQMDAVLVSLITGAVSTVVAYMTPPIEHFASELEKRYQDNELVDDSNMTDTRKL